MTTIDDDIIRRIADAISAAERIAILSGAGLSAESGVPTFREAQTGLWAKYDPLELATPEAFARDPETVTRWYDWRRELVGQRRPNAAHEALVALQRWTRAGASGAEPACTLDLITQNVDGLLQLAGANPVIELHGNIRRWRCTKTGDEVLDPPCPFEEYPPRSKAGGLLRPCVVWFGEALPEAALRAAFEAAQACDVFVSVGTSGVVYPAAGLFHVAKQAGAVTVEINAEATPATELADAAVLGRAGEVLPEIVRLVTQPT